MSMASYAYADHFIFEVLRRRLETGKLRVPPTTHLNQVVLNHHGAPWCIAISLSSSQKPHLFRC